LFVHTASEWIQNGKPKIKVVFPDDGYQFESKAKKDGMMREIIDSIQDPRGITSVSYQGSFASLYYPVFGIIASSIASTCELVVVFYVKIVVGS